MILVHGIAILMGNMLMNHRRSLVSPHFQTNPAGNMVNLHSLLSSSEMNRIWAVQSFQTAVSRTGRTPCGDSATASAAPTWPTRRVTRVTRASAPRRWIERCCASTGNSRMASPRGSGDGGNGKTGRTVEPVERVTGERWMGVVWRLLSLEGFSTGSLEYF